MAQATMIAERNTGAGRAISSDTGYEFSVWETTTSFAA